MAENAFNEKQDYLIKARDEVRKRDSMLAELDKMRNHQKKMSKSISTEEKSISDEIAATIKKRKQEISDIYDERIDDNNARKRKITNKRTKKKNQQIDDRIFDETKGIRDNIKELEIEMKTLYKQNKVPSLCNTNIFYYMFMPRGIEEILSMLLCFLIFFFGVAGAVVLLAAKFVLADKDINKAFWYVLIAAAVIILQLIIYFVIYNNTKNKHRDIIEQGRSIRDRIKASNRQIDAIKNSIRKEKDESKYNLQSYDKKLNVLEKEAESIGKEKQEALRQFEEKTKELIIDEINGRRIPAVQKMKTEKKEIDAKITKYEKLYSEKVIYITNQFAQFLGDDLCKEDKLTDLITIMEEDELETVSEAINIYKGQ